MVDEPRMWVPIANYNEINVTIKDWVNVGRPYEYNGVWVHQGLSYYQAFKKFPEWGSEIIPEDASPQPWHVSLIYVDQGFEGVGNICGPSVVKNDNYMVRYIFQGFLYSILIGSLIYCYLFLFVNMRNDDQTKDS